MAIERIGQRFIEVEGEDGLRNLIRVQSIQQATDADDFRESVALTVAGRTTLVRASFEEVRDVIAEDVFGRR